MATGGNEAPAFLTNIDTRLVPDLQVVRNEIMLSKVLAPEYVSSEDYLRQDAWPPGLYRLQDEDRIVLWDGKNIIASTNDYFTRPDIYLSLEVSVDNGYSLSYNGQNIVMRGHQTEEGFRSNDKLNPSSDSPLNTLEVTIPQNLTFSTLTFRGKNIRDVAANGLACAGIIDVWPGEKIAWWDSPVNDPTDGAELADKIKLTFYSQNDGEDIVLCGGNAELKKSNYMNVTWSGTSANEEETIPFEVPYLNFGARFERKFSNVYGRLDPIAFPWAPDTSEMSIFAVARIDDDLYYKSESGRVYNWTSNKLSLVFVGYEPGGNTIITVNSSDVPDFVIIDNAGNTYTTDETGTMLPPITQKTRIDICREAGSVVASAWVEPGSSWELK